MSSGKLSVTAGIPSIPGVTTAKTLRPGAQSFRNSGWLPRSKEAFDKFLLDLIKTIELPIYTTDSPTLLPPVQEFKDFIENDPTVFLEFNRMFDNIPDTERPKNYIELVSMFNEIFRTAPDFGSLGPPVYMIMANIMNSEGGFSAFTKDKLNFHFKKMFETWTLYLTSKDSRSVLNAGTNGWLNPTALTAMMKEFPNRTFDQVFICDTSADYYGYTSFEDFFNRRFRDPQTDRPTGPIDDLRLISAACESTSYAYQENVKRSDPLFIKDEAYSLVHLLADNYVDIFEGGTILQGFLNTTSYHRWHAPVNGVIQKIVDVPGTYFAQAPYTIGLPTDDDNDAPPYLKSLRFFANTAARQLIFIQSDNHKLGLMCFIAIGMTEISSCQATVYEGQHVKRGDELGMFHFGGSSSALVFRKAANVQMDDDYKVPEVALKINAPIATVSAV
ncbi:hypothetical protein D9758_013137 [Tetrapyrgos nigripes]|uniref:L-tryptophan decarboxylase PsiD-like domain-containing protein n=1 Tax=Tetrapyrgos nigripes TaxID=182062 RepID=A0A8H5CEN7_9AGAR|nr:hypothetical protein D9758_013137 [Tetrapyrgos nigripes]